MPLEWQPEYPDQHWREEGLGAQFQPYYAANSTFVRPQWRPRHPDLFPRRSTHAALQIQSPRSILPIATFPVVPLAWQGAYPDLVRRFRLGLTAPWSQPFGGNFRVVFPVAPLSWRARYPDRLPPRLRSILTVGDVTFVGALVIAPYRSWTPSYPDFARRRTLPPATLPFFVMISPSPFAVPALGWKGWQPDRVNPLPRLRAALQLAWAYGTFDPIKNPPPSLGGLIPIYPNQIPPKSGLRAASQLVFSINLDPLPNAAAPDQSWQQAIPTPIRRPGTQYSVSTGPITVPVPTLLVSMNWQGRWADVIRRRGMPALLNVFPFGDIVQIPFLGDWRPTYPPFLLRTVVPVLGFAGGGPSPIVPPIVDPDCLHLDDESVTYGLLLDETGEHATLIDETLIFSTLLNEDLC